MAAYKLVASDLDGTLLKDDQSLSPENAAAIREMGSKGISFAVSTGRTYGEILPALREDPYIRYYICSDGGLIYDKLENRRYTACISGELQKLVLDTLFSCQCLFTVHYNGVSYYDADRATPAAFQENNVSPYFQALLCQSDVAAKDFESFCRGMEEIEQITAFFHSDGELAQCRKRLLDTGLIETAWSAPCYMELYHAHAGKGKGLLRLAEILGVARSQTIAIGDTANDISILEAAGLGLATSNAKPELKQIADAVICSNEEHVAQYVLEHYL